MTTKGQELVDENYEQVEAAINILYKNFKDFGWDYSEGPMTRAQLEENITDMLLDYEGEEDWFCESGRIMVRVDELGLSIYLKVN